MVCSARSSPGRPLRPPGSHTRAGHSCALCVSDQQRREVLESDQSPGAEREVRAYGMWRGRWLRMDPLGCGEVLLCLVFGVTGLRLAKWTSPSLYFEMLVSRPGCKAGLGNSTFMAVLELETARQRPSWGLTEAISNSPPRPLRIVALVSFPGWSQCPSQPESASSCLWLRAGAQGSSE